MNDAEDLYMVGNPVYDLDNTIREKFETWYKKFFIPSIQDLNHNKDHYTNMFTQVAWISFVSGYEHKQNDL
jgi:hypothetical protein